MLDVSRILCLAASTSFLFVPATPDAPQDHGPKDVDQSVPVGYDDTPMLPGQPWRVHDKARPVPPVVTPGAGDFKQPPSDAIVLFDGSDLSKWVNAGKRDENGKPLPAKWKIENGYMEVNKTGSIATVDSFGDCQLHIEWASPAAVKGSSQGRGNSGVFFIDRYEIQILDSYENRSYADGQAGAFYGQHPPLVNACRKPGEWQSFDIIFETARFADGKLIKAAYATVLHNGVVIHHRTQLLGATQHKRVAKYSPHAPQGRIKLQDHGNPTRFRNIWVRRLKGYDEK